MSIDLRGEDFAKMIAGGAALLYQNRKTINEFNVFPVPDGDTGDNMFMTISNYSNDAADNSLENVSKSAAEAMLYGARGNSGVILSRIFAGLAKGFEGVEAAGPSELVEATKMSVAEAYYAVGKPQEGTMLTVYRDAVAYANKKIEENKNVTDYVDNLIYEAEKSLERTPELLPVLKDAGVVDSGGAGIVYILQGMKNALDGNVSEAAYKTEQKKVDLSKFTEDDILTFGYCTEFILRLQNSKVNLENFDEAIIKTFLENIGNSLVFFREGSIIKVHVHTFNPGEVLNFCRKFGEFLTIKIENMNLQHEETKENAAYSLSKPKKKTGIVTVATGSGVVKLFKEMGVDFVVDGGQSMNPSSEDFIRAYKEVNAEKIYVFPNNSNIILAAKQSAEIFTESEIIVVPTKNIGEGYIALSQFEPALSFEEIMESFEGISVGQVSKAIRTANIDGISIDKDSYIGFSDKKMLACNEDKNACAEGLLKAFDTENFDILLVIYGENVTSQELSELEATLADQYKRTEIITIEGNQPIYDYIFVMY